MSCSWWNENRLPLASDVKSLSDVYCLFGRDLSAEERENQLKTITLTETEDLLRRQLGMSEKQAITAKARSAELRELSEKAEPEKPCDHLAHVLGVTPKMLSEAERPFADRLAEARAKAS